MIDFINKLFGREKSSTTAKERLRLVLLSDHLSLAPELVDELKRELVDVISRYVEVDRSRIEVNFEQQDKAVAMMANIPILSMHPPKNDGGGGNGPSGGEKVEQQAKKPRRRKRPAPTSNPAPAT